MWHPTPVLLPGKFYGQRCLVGCSPWGREESDTTERLHFHFSFSCIEEGNSNPLQCSCLENLRDGGAWWISVYGVAQSWTRLKRLSSSSSSSRVNYCSNNVDDMVLEWSFCLFCCCCFPGHAIPLVYRSYFPDQESSPCPNPWTISREFPGRSAETLCCNVL